MRVRLGFAVALAALVIFPAAAQAVPPDNDAYWFSTQINDPGTGLLGTGDTRGTYQEFTDNSEATTQNDILDPPGDIGTGPPEATRCQLFAPPDPTRPFSAFGKTLWWDVHPDRNGYLVVEVTGFDAVFGFTQYDSSGLPVGPYPCQDDRRSTSRESMAQVVRKGAHYSIQVGGFAGFLADPNDPDPSTPDSDTDLELDVDFIPDSDLDGTYDSSDQCKGTAGPKGYQGCPDSDGDLIPNQRDRCDFSRAPDSAGGINGCPDGDKDGVADRLDGAANPDKCVGENASGRDSNRNGCLDILRLDDLVTPSLSFPGVKHGRLRIKKFRVLGVPRGARISVQCQGPKRRHHRRRKSCGKTSKTASVSVAGGPSARAARTVKLKRFGGRRGLRVGSLLIIRVTARKAIGKYVRYKIVRSGVKRLEGCMDQGAKKSFRKKGCRSNELSPK